MRSFGAGRLRRAVALVAFCTIAGTGVTGASKPISAVPSNPDDKAILHVLNRIGFGARPGDVERVRRMGLSAYVEQQLHPERVADEAMNAHLADLSTLHKSSREIAEEYFVPAMQARRAAKQDPAPKDDRDKPQRTPEQMEAQRRARGVVEELSEQKILRAAYSDRQLEEVMTDFWFNHFNVFAGKGATQIYVTEYERDAIRPHVLGRFRDLLEATAASPAMLFYLDNWQSADPNASTTVRPAPLRMRPRGFGDPIGRRPRRPPPPMPAMPGAQDQNAQRTRRGLNENYGRELLELHTLGVDGGYTQQDVIAVARCFTGWTIAAPRQGGGFRFEPRLHDAGEKTVLGQKIKAGGGREDGERVLDILAKHPSTARFITTKLVRRFVSDIPPESLVTRATARFRETDGDIREVLGTILTSPEFFAADAYRAKVKTPFEFVVSAVRATQADVTSALGLVQAVRQLGMPLYFCQPPTGYADRADAWVNTGALLNRMNFALSLVSGRIRGVQTPVDALQSTPDVVRAPIVAAALAGDVSETTATTVARASDARQVAALTLGSPEFQRR
jgi:uncharacterized protein (DUF1800 family)